jgi:hypothetical protein
MFFFQGRKDRKKKEDVLSGSLFNETARIDHGIFALKDILTDYIDSEFSGAVESVAPQIYWDTACIKEEVNVYYRFYITDTGKIVRVNSAKVSQFLSDFSTIAIAVPSDRCSTSLFSWLDGVQSEFETIRTVIPYKLDTCEFSSIRIKNQNGFITSMVSSFPDTVRQSFENALSLFFAQGGAVVSVCDRIFPLTAYIASEVDFEEKKTVMGVERRGENYLVWNMTKTDGKIIPVNSNQFRISEINPENDIFRTCAFLTSEAIKIHKFPPAEKMFFIDVYAGKNDIPRSRAMQSVRDSVSSISETAFMEVPNAVLSGMVKAV